MEVVRCLCPGAAVVAGESERGKGWSRGIGFVSNFLSLFVFFSLLFVEVPSPASRLVSEERMVRFVVNFAS